MTSESTPTAELTLREAPVIYVNLKKKCEEYDVPDNLSDMIKDLQQVFMDNMYETKKSFRTLDISEVVDYILSYIPSLLSLSFRKHKAIELIQKEFEDIKTTTQLFKTLEKYVSWFNFEFVIKLVSAFITDNRDIQRKWSTYHEKLKDYFKNNSTQAVQIDNAIQFGLSNVPGTKVMVAKVEKDDYTLNDLYFFREAIVDALKVPKYQLYFCTIENGCMELKYCIPDFLYSLLFPLTNQQCYSLAEIGIIKVTCGEYVHEMEKVCHQKNYIIHYLFSLQLPDNKIKKPFHSAIGNLCLHLIPIMYTLYLYRYL